MSSLSSFDEVSSDDDSEFVFDKTDSIDHSLVITKKHRRRIISSSESEPEELDHKTDDSIGKVSRLIDSNESSSKHEQNESLDGDTHVTLNDSSDMSSEEHITDTDNDDSIVNDSRDTLSEKPVTGNDNDDSIVNDSRDTSSEKPVPGNDDDDSIINDSRDASSEKFVTDDDKDDSIVNDSRDISSEKPVTGIDKDDSIVNDSRDISSEKPVTGIDKDDSIVNDSIDTSSEKFVTDDDKDDSIVNDSRDTSSEKPVTVNDKDDSIVKDSDTHKDDFYDAKKDQSSSLNESSVSGEDSLIHNSSCEYVGSDSIQETSSSDDEVFPIETTRRTQNQPSIKKFLSPAPIRPSKSTSGGDVIKHTSSIVSTREYEVQKNVVEQIKNNFFKTTNMIRTLDLNKLPDNGELLLKKRNSLEQDLAEAEKVLENMVAKKVEQHQWLKNVPNWQLLQSEAAAVVPRTFGETALATINNQRSLTMERLEQLHKSLATCPVDSVNHDDPGSLKVELLPHQKQALSWLMWREKENPSGGILADDMGLGKTLTMISLLLKSMEIGKKGDDEDDEWSSRRSKYLGGTLVICPASLINHWEKEIYDKVNRNKLSVELFHGTKRENNRRKLSQYDVVITTYTIVTVENKKGGVLFGINWRRIILDEGHSIRNHKALTSVAACKLEAKSRWVLTGTPVHNKELDLYALLKFLRCSPFDDLPVWKRWVANKTTGGQERLNTVISSLLLRRTKEQLIKIGALDSIPQREWKLIEITLEKNEMDFYQKLLILSRTLFAQYLHQRAEKNAEVIDLNMGDPNSEYSKMHQKLVKMNKAMVIKQHEILVLLLKLRQLCCHPHLVKSSMNIDENYELETSEEIDLLQQLNNLNLNESNQENIPMNMNENVVSVTEAIDSILPNSSIFNVNRLSSKIKVVLDTIKNEVLPKGDKCVIVSQWTSLLDIIAIHLHKENMKYVRLDGKVPVPNRMSIVNKINESNNDFRILLLSLTAGGVGLNLIGANHLLLLDLHWNPQLEMQAQDRIYRFGQKKPVFIYKFITSHTIEERVYALQKKKINLADAVLSGAKIQQTKLTMDDLKMLFNM